MDILLSVFLPLSLAFITFTLGIGLTGADFLRVVRRPAAFLTGAVCQVLLLPLVALAVIWVFQFKAEIAVGIMILAVCPGGATSNIITKLGRGDVALSVSLTAVISLASALTVPLVLALSMDAFMGSAAPEISVARTAFAMFALTAVPILIGLWARRLAPRAMARVEPVLSGIATALFIIIVLGALGANWGLFQQHILTLGPALAVLAAILLALGFAAARAVGRPGTEAKAISVETGIQNATLGITVAALMVGEGAGISPYAIPAGVYGVLMFLVVAPVILIFRRMA